MPALILRPSGRTPRGTRRKQLALVAAAMPVALAMQTHALADTITYTPPGSAGSITPVVTGNLEALSLTAGAGVTSPTSTVNSLQGTGFDGATSSNQALNANNYFTFTAAPAANYALDLTQLTAFVSRDSVTPAPDRARWFYSIDSFGTGLGTGNTTVTNAGVGQTVALTNTAVTAAVEFRIAAWSSGTGALASTYFSIGPTTPVILTATSTLRTDTTLTWDGGRGDGNWNSYLSTNSNQSNWDLNKIPAAGLVDDLIFAGNSQRNTTNNIAGTLTVGSITFAANVTNAFTLNGNAINLNNGVTSLNAANHTITLDMALNGPSVWNAASSGAIRMQNAINNNGFLITATGTGDVSFTGAISGSGGLTKNGTGALTINANNFFTGDVTLNGGTIFIKNVDSTETDPQSLGTSPNAITLGSALTPATLVYTGTASATINRGFNVGGAGATFRTTGGNLTLNNNGTTSGIATSGGALLTFDANTANVSVSGTISGTGTSIVKMGTGSLTFSSGGNSSYDGSITIQSGLFSINSISTTPTNTQPLGTGTSAITLSTVSPATFQFTGGSNSTLNRGFIIGAANAATFRATSGNLTLGTAGTTSGISTGGGALLTFDANPANITVAGAITGASTAIVKTGTGSLVLQSTGSTYDGAISVNAGTLSVNSIDSTATNSQPLGAGTSAIALGSTGTAATFLYNGSSNTTLNRGITVVDAAGATIRATDGNLTFSAGVTAAAPGAALVFDAGSGTNITVSGAIIGSSASITKISAGTLVLTSTASTFNGVTTVSAGQLSVNSITVTPTTPQPLGTATSALVVGSSASSGTFAYTGNSGTTLSRDIVVGGAGGAILQTTKGKLTFAGNISAGGNPLTFGGADKAYVNGVISGSGTVTKADTGTLTLTAANTFTGPLSVNAGILSIASIDPVPINAQPLGQLDGPITVCSATPGTLEYTGSAASLNRQIIVGGAGGAIIRATGGALTLDTDGATSGIAGGGFPLTFDADGAGITVNSDISGTGTSITKTGGNTVTLKGDNTFDGSVTINDGTLTVNSLNNTATAPQPLGVATGPIILGSSDPATLSINVGSTKTLNRAISLGGAGGGIVRGNNASGIITLGQGVNGNGFPLTLEATGTLLVAAPITGSGTTLTKTGTGLAGMNGSYNTYTGTTDVQAGTLAIGSPMTNSSSVSVQSGALLLLVPTGATNLIRTQNVTVNGTGRLDVGDGKMILTAGAVGTISGSAYDGVTGLIQSGRNTGGWGGSGIVTSETSATTGNYTSIGVATASDVRPATATATDLWAGQTITGTDVLVMYTYGGDATLDGKINVDDYIKIDSGIAAGLTGWVNGDFNYDGKVSIDDYITVIDANIGIQSGVFPTGSGIGGVSAVPEPAVGSILALGALIFARRRKTAAND